MESSEIPIAVNYLLPIASRYASLAIQFAIMTIIARSLNPGDAGIYFYISGAVLTFYLLAGFGLPDGMLVSLAPRIESHRCMQDVQALHGGSLISIFASLSLPVAAAFFAYVFHPSTSIAMACGVWVMGYCLVFIASQIFSTLGRIKVGTAIFYSVPSIALLFTTMPYLIFSDTHSILNVIYISATATFAAGTFCIISGFLIIQKAKNREKAGDYTTPHIWGLSEAWREGALIASSRLVQNLIFWLPVWITGIAISAEAAADAGLATRITVAFGAALAAVNFSLRPKVARLAHEMRWQEVQRVNRLIAMAASALTAVTIIIVAFFGEQLVTALFGAGYSVAALLLLIFLFSTFIESASGSTSEILKMSGDARFVLLAQIGSLIVSGASSAVLVRVYGILGPAMGFVIGFLVLYCTIIIFAYRKRKILPFHIPISRRNSEGDCGHD